MKRSIIKLIIAIIMLIAGYLIFGLFIKRTPANILKKAFNISLIAFDYDTEEFQEQWYPNGDGHLLIVYKFNKLTQENIDYLKSFSPQSLPVSKTMQTEMAPNKLPSQYLDGDVGYYLYEFEDGTSHNFKFFIVDLEANRATLYYQYM